MSAKTAEKAMEPLAASTTETAAAADAPLTGERLPMMEIGLERVARALQAAKTRRLTRFTSHASR
jgi:hypothetical protein